MTNLEFIGSVVIMAVTYKVIATLFGLEVAMISAFAVVITKLVAIEREIK